MKRKQIVVCKEEEYLAARVGKVDKADSVILTFRTMPQSSFESANFALSATQAKRLLADLTSLFETSERLSKLPIIELDFLDD